MSARTPLRYAVVVSMRDGYAGRFVDRAAARSDGAARLVAVVYCLGRGDAARRRRLLRRRLRKALALGVLGAAHGLLARRWFGSDLRDRLAFPDIVDACREHGVPVVEIASFFDPAGQNAVRALDLDLAISMGNGYIPERFFTIPRFGMINVHHELLPEYRGAQTALWQIHDGSRVSGFTIHEVTRRIDGGRILAREAVPLRVAASLRDTVVETSAAVQTRSIERLLDVLERFQECRAAALPNEGGGTYTTPGTRALIRIYRNHRRLRREAAPEGRTS